jgi:hypothetical protein
MFAKLFSTSTQRGSLSVSISKTRKTYSMNMDTSLARDYIDGTAGIISIPDEFLHSVRAMLKGDTEAAEAAADFLSGGTMSDVLQSVQIHLLDEEGVSISWSPRSRCRIAEV